MSSIIRESNIELLRIVSMFLVVLSHFYVHGAWPLVNELTFNNVAIYALDVGKIGVAAFVLISGYFLISKSFDIIKLAKLVLQIWFYGIVTLIIAYVFETSVITEKFFWGSIMPFYSLNWFAKAYLLLYLVFPLINRLIRHLEKKRLKRYILGFGFIWTVLPVFSMYEHGNIRITVMFIYCIGAYLYLYGCRWLNNMKNTIILSFTSYFAIILTVIILWWMSLSDGFFMAKPSSFLALNSVLVLLCGIGLFCTFVNIKIKSNIINKIASTMFGVYLIHDNPMIAGWMWNKLLNVSHYYESAFLVPISVLFSILVIIICSLIDYLRIEYIERPLFGVIAPVLRNLQSIITIKFKKIRNS